ELDDLVEPLLNLPFGEAEHDAVDEHVLAAGDFRMKAGAELDERRDAAVDAHDAAGRLRDAGDELQRRALARSVPADDAVGRPLRHGERDVGERRKRLARLQVAHEAALQQRALERRELTAGVAAVDLRDVRQLDRRGHREYDTYDTECTENTETINHRDTETQRRWSAEHAEGKRRSVRRPACSAGRHARPDRTETRDRGDGDGSRFRPTPVARGASRRRRTEASLCLRVSVANFLC